MSFCSFCFCKVRGIFMKMNIFFVDFGPLKLNVKLETCWNFITESRKFDADWIVGYCIAVFSKKKKTMVKFTTHILNSRRKIFFFYKIHRVYVCMFVRTDTFTTKQFQWKVFCFKSFPDGVQLAPTPSYINKTETFSAVSLPRREQHSRKEWANILFCFLLFHFSQLSCR